MRPVCRDCALPLHGRLFCGLPCADKYEDYLRREAAAGKRRRSVRSRLGGALGTLVFGGLMAAILYYVLVYHRVRGVGDLLGLLERMY